MSLTHSRILLGVSGGIAAYKAAELVRLLRKAGAQVKVVMTASAQQFITPMTLQALSGEPVRSTLFDPAHEAAMGHIELARWPEKILIAPCSANLLARLAHGLADDLLTTLCLASDRPIALAPAMNQRMWQNPLTQQNLERLQSHGFEILGPAEGAQACGETGPGRMLEPQEILTSLKTHATPLKLQGRHLLITAGPTREPIDPVRFLSNRSSGKMGFAIAAAAAQAGAKVTLISGPVSLNTPPGVQRLDVQSAQQMYTAVMQQIGQHGIFIATAAVADYRPVASQPHKLKKSAAQLHLELVRNPDILAEVTTRYPQIFSVGFAAETQDLERYAQEKLIRKQLNMIVANPVNDNQGFERDDNTAHVFWHGGEHQFPTLSKQELAHQLISLIAEQLQTD